MFACRRGSGLNYRDFYAQVDYDLLYADLGWEPQESRGAEDKGYCLDPWKAHKHGDTTGKLAINRDKGVYNCWVCGGGRVLDLVMAVKDMTIEEATAYLWEFTRKEKVSPQEFYEKVTRLLAEEPEQKKQFPIFNRMVIEAWVDNDHEWFRERHIDDEVRTYFSLGFNPATRIFKANVGSYEGPAIILPHFWNHKLVGWQHRWLDDDRPKWLRKYTNTTEFPREETVWGYDFAAKNPNPPIIVESVPTALMLLSEGYPAIATFGAQITTSQLKHLRGFQSGVLLAPDNDEPGQEWLQRATRYLERYIKVLHVPPVNGEGSDLGDLDPEELSIHLKGVIHAS